MYLYRTVIYHTTTNVVTLPANNTADVADFEGASKKPNALEIQSLDIAETTFQLPKSYSDFDSLITGDIEWSDVKYINESKAYVLFLASETEL